MRARGFEPGGVLAPEAVDVYQIRRDAGGDVVIAHGNIGRLGLGTRIHLREMFFRARRKSHGACNPCDAEMQARPREIIGRIDSVQSAINCTSTLARKLSLLGSSSTSTSTTSRSCR